MEFDREGERRTIYSLRHTYATFRLHEGVNHFVLARNMGTSVKMLEQFYGHTSNRAMARRADEDTGEGEDQAAVGVNSSATAKPKIFQTRKTAL